jgi:predicted metal-binding membrane protein
MAETRMSESAHSLDHLPSAAARLGALFARPKWLAAFCVLALAGLGWFYLGLLTAGMAAPSSTLLPRAIAVICQTMPQSGVAAALLVTLMWSAMVLAMMLPSAAPMIFTYAEVADTAARKGERIISPFVLAGGYGVVWLGFAAAAAMAQVALTRAAWLDASMASTSALFSGAIFIAAGLYQFSPLKHACLTQCQHPFPFFFTNWATTPRGVFRLGLKQGLYCVGCCWAMMLVMFAVGVMNVLWMVPLGMVMTIEKMLTGRRLTYAVGVVLIAIGGGVIATAVAAHWPTRAI